MDRHERRYISDGRDRGWGGYDDERITEREVIYSNSSGGKGRRTRW